MPMSVIDYLDADVAYFIGLIIGRGEMTRSQDSFRIRLTFRFILPELEGLDQFSGFVESVAGQSLRRLQNLLGPFIYFDIEPNQSVNLLITLPNEHLIVRNLRYILTGGDLTGWPLHYQEYRVPRLIKLASADLQREFMRGFADISGNIRRSNRDQLGYHRVFLDVLSGNWFLPIDICNLLQDDLNVPVANILWGHPNLRDPQAKQQTGVIREHQVRIYAEDFLKIGFYIGHKQKALEKLSDENTMIGRRSPHKCDGYSKRIQRKAPHPLENDPSLPEAIRGQHFDNYYQICRALGCPKALEAPLPIPMDFEEAVDEE
jgi:hypothetical protein